MTIDWTIFGKPDLFEIAVRWRGDSEPRGRRPKGYGWSIGDLRITVASQNITSNQRGAARQSYVSWYLLPLLTWIAKNWTKLLHEEDFAWRTNSSLPAAVACPNALEHWIDAEDPQGQLFYRDARSWHRRHCIRAAAEGGLFPDLYLRRYLDTIEVSWTGTSPPFAGETFSFVTEPAAAFLPVAAVAEPLWGLLQWACGGKMPSYDDDMGALEAFRELVAGVELVTDAELEAAYAPANVLELARSILMPKADLLADVRVPKAPALAYFSPAAAMFGGVSPDLSTADVETLSRSLAAAGGGRDSEALAALVDDPGFPKTRAPYVEGQELAVDVLEDVRWNPSEGWVDIRAIVDRLGIVVSEAALETDTIRGVALAGEGIQPTILVNLTSPYNGSEEGRRFSIAHELCHILFDRSHAKRVAVSSGPWAPPGVEKRANAFAAMLLMPRTLVSKGLDAEGTSHDRLTRLAKALHVSELALAEHAYNMGLLGESERERARAWKH